jgi:hypothetical protein
MASAQTNTEVRVASTYLFHYNGGCAHYKACTIKQISQSSTTLI